MQSGSRRIRRLLATLMVAGGTMVASAGIRSERVLAAIVERTPAPRIVAEGAQLKSAEKLAATLPGATALLGIGHSMEPLYATNTAVIVQEISYQDLRKGMTVVYLKRNGGRVAHSIVGETRGGFLAQGVNNDKEDADLITEDNFIGIITHAFASADTRFRVDMEKRIVAKAKPRPNRQT